MEWYLNSSLIGSFFSVKFIHDGLRPDFFSKRPNFFWLDCWQGTWRGSWSRRGRCSRRVPWACSCGHPSGQPQHPTRQCWGSGSRFLGSVCFWASWIRILLSSSKNKKKNLDSNCFVTSLWLFILENVPSKSNKQFFVGVLKVKDESMQDPDPDTLVRGTDPRIRIRTRNVTDPQHFYQDFTMSLIF